MTRATIDQREVEVREGSTILDAARALGIDIPTLCHLEGRKPQTSCMVCMVKVGDPGRLLPACGTRVQDGMQVESETEEVAVARRAALELLLSDHAGDCLAPCQSICPAHMNIPVMIRQIAAGQFREAIMTAKEHIALPAVLGRICTKPCEKGCRRCGHDSAVSVCLLKQVAADEDLAEEEPYLPEQKPARGKKVAIIGTGPAGLAAAYYLLQEGYACTLFDDHELPGGMLRFGVTEDRLPRAVLDGEIRIIEKLGAEFRLGVRVGEQVSFEEIRKGFDAVLIAAGELDPPGAAQLGFGGTAQGVRSGGIAADSRTYATALDGVFAAGGAVRKSRLSVRSVAEGREAAGSIVQYLGGLPVARRAEPFNHRLVQVAPIEVMRMASGASSAERVVPGAGAVRGFTREEAQLEAGRCLGCDCRKLGDCRLRAYAQRYGADSHRFKGERRQIEVYRQQAGVIFEPGKCISCGLCIQITEDAREPLGLTFIGRGFSVRVGVPFNRTLEEGLQKVAEEVVAVCPTGALAFADRTRLCLP